MDSPNPNGSGLAYETFEEARDVAIESLEEGIARLKAAEPPVWPNELHEFIALHPVEMDEDEYAGLEEME
jgi:hypothetical protein